MRVYRVPDYNAMSRKAANLLSAHIILDPDCTVGLATGSTPLGMYGQLVEWYGKGDIDFSGVTFYNLDEYVGIAKDDPNSYGYFMNENLFRHINAKKSRINIPDGMAADLAAECRRYDAIISGHPIGVQVLGIGHDGHIGFNEPGAAFETGTHVVELARATRTANSRFFSSPDEVPERAITMGVKNILQSKRILLLVSGADKSDILARALHGPVTPEVPASILQLHGDVIIVGDEAALKRICI